MAMSIGHHPQRLHETVQLSPEEVLEDINSYLSAALTDPSRHPNAMLTESGPVAVSNGDSFGLALHNLQRLQSGLRGEHLVPDPVIQTAALDATPDTTPKKGRLKSVATASDSEDQQGWQDREEFDREQEISDGHAEGTAPPVVREESLAQDANSVPQSSVGAGESKPSKSQKVKRAKKKDPPDTEAEENEESKPSRKKHKKDAKSKIAKRSKDN